MLNRHSIAAALAAGLFSCLVTHAQVRAPAPLHAGFTKDGLAGTLAGVPSYGWPEEIGFRGLLLDRSALGLTGPVKHVRAELAYLPRGGQFKKDAPALPDTPESQRCPLYEAWFDADGRVERLRTWDLKVNDGVPGWELRYVWEGARLARIDGGAFDFKEPTLRISARHDTAGRLVELTNERLVQGAWCRDAREELVFDGDRPIKLVVDRRDGISTETIIRRDEGGYRLQRFVDERLNFASSREVDAQGRLVRSKVAEQPAVKFTYDDRGRLAAMTPEGGDSPRWRRLPADPATPNVSIVEYRLDNIGTTFIYTEKTHMDTQGNAERIDVRVSWRGKQPPGGFGWPVGDHRVYWTIEYDSKADRAKPDGTK